MIETLLTLESNLVSHRVIISNAVMNSSASNHLEISPLTFHVPSQAFLGCWLAVVFLLLMVGLLAVGFAIGTELAFAAEILVEDLVVVVWVEGD